MECLDEDEVLSFLDGALAPDEVARLEGHLADCADCRQLLAFMAKEESSTGRRVVSAAEPPSSDELGVGHPIDHFEIERLLGRGGMGEIYLAEDTQLHRKVALKVIAPGLLDAPEAQERFLVEARATARFNHPHVVTIHSVGRYRGRPYLALEYVEGETLRARLDRGPVPLTEALQLARAITAALVEAHRHQVLHRDLKPQNVMLGKDGRARVLDFGLAKLVKVEPSDTHSLFETKLDGRDTLRGTPAYMAPEQWKKEPVGAAADVWALGVILYELLSGSRPYREPSPIAYAVKVCEVGPAPPLPNSVGLPEGLVVLVAGCLEKRAADRPAASVVLEVLDGLLDDDSLKLANELERAAERWQASGQPEGTLWDRQRLDSAQRVLSERAFPLAAPAAKFLSASLQLEGRRAEQKRRRLLGAAVGFGVVALAFFVIGRIAIAEREEAEAERKRAVAAAARALLEGARSAFLAEKPQEARAKLRSALELADAPGARVLRRQLERSPLLASAHLGTGLYDLVVSPDGQTIAVAAQDHTIYLYDADLLNVRSLRGHGDQVIALAFAPDGLHLASASWSGELRVWSLADGSARAFTGLARVTALGFDPSGASLAVADVQGNLQIHSLQGDTPPRRLEAQAVSNELQFSPDGQHLYTADRDGRARRYALGPGTVEQAFGPEGSGALISLVLHQNFLIAGRDNGEILRLDATGQTTSLGRRVGPIERLRVEGPWLYGAGADQKLWRLPLAGGDFAELGHHLGNVWGLAVFEARVISAGQDGSIKVWRKEPSAAEPVGPGDSVAAVVHGPDGELWSAGYDRRVLRWRDGAAQRFGEVAQGTLYGLAMAGPYGASASLDRQVRLWRRDQPGPVTPLLGHSGGVYAVAFDPAARRLASASSDGTVRLWDPERQAALGVWAVHQGPVFAVAWSSDGKGLVSGGADKTVRWLDPKSPGKSRVILELPGPVRGLAFSPDGRRLAVVGYDPEVRVLDLATEEVKVIGRHQGRVYAVAFSPDGARIASAGADGTVHMVDPDGGRRLEFVAHPGEVNALSFAPDGATLVSGGDDGTVRRFDLGGRPLDRPRAVGAAGKLLARQAEAWVIASDADTICLSDGAHLEAWDRSLEERRFSAPLVGGVELWVWGRGCLARSDGRLLRYDGRGAFLEVASAVQAAAVDGVHILYASGNRARRLNADQAILLELPTGPGVTALASDGQHLWAGYENGTVERLGPGAPANVGVGGTSPVLRLSLAHGLLAAGHQNGLFELYELETLTRVEAQRLHGPISALSIGPEVWAHSALGQAFYGPDSLDRSWCNELRTIWRDTPFFWQSGRAERTSSPKDHPCFLD
ncbi:MAG: protein kinase [Deltaproteobacteria bacterium]|nr:protein kinase [Deltaproteobacteria bacterium]